jgi:hypothetical protein
MGGIRISSFPYLLQTAAHQMQLWHQTRTVNVSTLSTAFRVRPVKRPRLLFIGSPWHNPGASATSLGTELWRPHKFRTRPCLILVSSLPYPPSSDMSARRPYSTNAQDDKLSLVNKIKESPTRGLQDAHDHTHDHETSHSHSHSIFGHSHSNGVEAHNHGTEQIIAALEGKGRNLFLLVINIHY